jgi:hypothetical protein
MRCHSIAFQSRLFLALEDFNAILSSSNKCGGDPTWYGYKNDICSCLQSA